MGTYIAVTGIVAKDLPLPVIPLYDLTYAAQLIPCHANTLRHHLSQRKAEFPAVYRRESTGRRVRLLTAEEIIRVRAKMLKGPGLANVLTPYHHNPTL